MLQKVGDSMIDSVIGDNIPIFTEQEKFNETVTSSVKRLEASLTGNLHCPLRFSRSSRANLVSLRLCMNPMVYLLCVQAVVFCIQNWMLIELLL